MATLLSPPAAGPRHRTGFAILAAALLCAAGRGAEPAPVDFAREVRPILASRCFKCHGPDDQTRKAGLRLDLREAAIRPPAKGPPAIVPGQPAASALISRVLSADPDEVMPPPATKWTLTEAEKRTFERWVAEGAEYRAHWAFVPPVRPPLPEVNDRRWARHPIDRFVYARLEAEGLEPSPPADRRTLVRRVYLDLIGLPPTPEEAAAFLQDRAPGAYERLVDRLLASPHYGERWARRWLDLARYADTNGYEKDRPRSVWPWRDWVIEALNRDLPFDRFTVEQLAGDLLPNPTVEQRVATGFHRNTMLNEEGGIDPLEYRFHAMVDRVATTGTAWLGLTLGCAQCHTHKYDPITQREYYRFMAFLDNADEPELELARADVSARQREHDDQVAAALAALPDRWPVPEVRWVMGSFQARSTAGTPVEPLEDGSVRFAGDAPERDVYVFETDTDFEEVRELRLEALADERLPHRGPGRAENGNFVVSELQLEAASRANPTDVRQVRLASAEADAAQKDYPAAHAIDGDEKTGWAVDTGGDWHTNRALRVVLDPPLRLEGGGHLLLRVVQAHGGRHLLGRVRLALGIPLGDTRPVATRRAELVEQAHRNWLERETARAVRWQIVRPSEASSNLPWLTIEPDDAVFVTGDMTKSDTYRLKFSGDWAGVTAIRIEALADPRLPSHGPGRTYYEGPKGDFFLSEFGLRLDGAPVKCTDASESHARTEGNNRFGARQALDGDPHTAWSIHGRVGETHYAVFNLDPPLEAGRELEVQLLFERYHAAGLGRFRLAVTRDTKKAVARPGSPEIDTLLCLPASERTAEQQECLRREFLWAAPELAGPRREIEELRRRRPSPPTALVFEERPPANPRPTLIRQRGEFLQPGERVEPGLPAFLPPLEPGAPVNRLGLAQWLVSPRNPLTARVTVNRQWAAFFGRGLVRTLEDFGLQGELPTHPELLDWLATEFVGRGWSLKQLHRLIVTSATYRQSSRVTPDRLAKDPDNRLLSRGPRFRVEAEFVRDAALQAAGLLSPKLGGPSVFPPQPPGVTTEGAYGPLEWKVSDGPDRYRRALYTFSKRTAPYAMLATFDGPSGEACVARRDVSNTPLQALTLLNDGVVVEAAQALGRSLAERDAPDARRVAELFRRVLARRPQPDELRECLHFLETQRGRLRDGSLDPAALAGPGDGDRAERAAWTALARVLLNLDEFVTKR